MKRMFFLMRQNTTEKQAGREFALGSASFVKLGWTSLVLHHVSRRDMWRYSAQSTACSAPPPAVKFSHVLTGCPFSASPHSLVASILATWNMQCQVLYHQPFTYPKWRQSSIRSIFIAYILQIDIDVCVYIHVFVLISSLIMIQRL